MGDLRDLAGKLRAKTGSTVCSHMVEGLDCSICYPRPKPKPALSEATDMDTIAANFLAHMPANRVDSVKRNLSIILPIYASGGEIYNMDLQDAKTALNRAFEDGMEALGQLDYRDRSELGFGLSLYSVPSLIKKLNGKGPKAGGDYPKPGWTASPEVLAKWKEFMAAMLPVSKILNDLKSKVVKGKKPLTPEKAAVKAAQLAKKDMKTCACCFRGIARYPNGLIADHGYTLPPRWGKTPSCPGRMFRPLEVSDDGLKYMVKLLTERVAYLNKLITEFPSRTELNVKSYGKKQGDLIGKDDPRWDATYKQALREFTDDLEDTSKSLKMFQHKLASWQPTETTESIGSLTEQLRALTSG